MTSAFRAMLLAIAFAFAARASDDPVIRMLVPGFTVQELPVRLSNLNNLRFAPDGRLFALAYDGRIHILTDTDGDGLEDHDQLFWDKATISVPVGMVVTAEGVYVSSHGKVSFLHSATGSDHAVSEEIIASGWAPTDVASGGVDATAITCDKFGNIYFGLIAADYSNPYRVKDGVSHYDLHGKRGTIQKLPRTGKTFETTRATLETIATGIRVPYSLAFNKANDLFCTDQEGETWCPNGNPLDELNWILPNHNYGFPPKDDKWLPNLKSDAPIIAFGPQHQSTCGMVFNVPSKHQALLGPPWWNGDAFIAGESRGKIWRARLVKTDHGYVGKEFLIARLSMLTTDVAISPKGALYVCCHSGQPDWGTGPKGEGRIFKITYSDPKAPQPVFTWRTGVTEVRVAFDKALDPAITNPALANHIEFGEFVRAADRYEKLKPPYKVVQQQESAPRGKLKIVAATLADKQTLVLKTDPQSLPVSYAFTLTGVKAAGAPGSGATVDLDYDLGTQLSQADSIALTRSLPHGEQIVASLTKVTDWAEPQKLRYPTIHPAESQNQPVELAGGVYENGRSIFFNDKQKCATCHRIREEGATIAPDLSNLVSKDANSVLRDIKDPSASINPDYVAYLVELKNGESLTGFVRAQDGLTLKLMNSDGKEVSFPQTDVISITPSRVSLMPAGLIDNLEPAKIKDLLTFLLSEAPKRSPQEKLSIAKLSQVKSSAPKKPIRVILIASKQDHGKDQHDYPAWQKTWHGLLETETATQVEDAWLWPTPKQFETADVLVFYYWNHDWNPEKFAQLDEYLERGGGIVALHSATIGNPDPRQLAERIGLSSDSGKTKYRHTPIALKLAESNSPITAGLPREIHFLDEPYWPMVGDTNKINVLATADIDGGTQPMMWTCEKSKGRVFVSIFGHYTWTLDDPFFRAIILRGIAWAAHTDPNQFLELATSPH